MTARRRKVEQWRPVCKDRLSIIAWILGPFSAAQKALWEMARREKNGEQVGCFIVDGAFVVGPVEEGER